MDSWQMHPMVMMPTILLISLMTYDLIDWVWTNKMLNRMTEQNKMVTLMTQTAASKGIMKTTFNSPQYNKILSIYVHTNYVKNNLPGQTTLWINRSIAGPKHTLELFCSGTPPENMAKLFCLDKRDSWKQTGIETGGSTPKLLEGHPQTVH